jgi:hypothetical protein
MRLYLVSKPLLELFYVTGNLEALFPKNLFQSIDYLRANGIIPCDSSIAVNVLAFSFSGGVMSNVLEHVIYVEGRRLRCFPQLISTIQEWDGRMMIGLSRHRLNFFPR